MWPRTINKFNKITPSFVTLQNTTHINVGNRYKRCWTTPKYVVLPIQESNNEKRVCNPTLEAGSPTPNGNHICTKVGCGHGSLLLRPFPHLLLEGDSVGEEPNVWKSATDKTHFYHTGKEEFMDQTSRVHWSTKRICTYPAFVRVETCKCQIEQYSYMQTITYTFVGATIVSMSGCASMSWLLDVSLFIMVTYRNGKMRRKQSTGTTSVQVFFRLPS
jgi:hypothetical protein